MLSSFRSRIIGFSARHAALVVAITFALTLVFGYFCLRVKINPDFNSLMPQDAEVNRLLKEYAGETAQSDILILAATAADIMDAGRLSAFSEAVTSLGAIKGVRSTVSPFNLVSFGREKGRLSVRPMSPGGAMPSADDMEEFRSRLSSARYARNLVISADGTMLIAYFQTDPMGSFKEFMRSVDTVVEGMRARGLTPYVTGTIPLSVRTEYHLSRDIAWLLGLAVLIVLASYIITYRSPRAVVYPLISTLVGTLWTVGFMGAAGFSFSLITIVTPPLILIFGNEYNIFTTSEYLRLAREEGTAPGWIERASRNVTAPIAMAVLTTVVGFLSLLTTSIRQTREFALTASFGALACAFLALFFLPALYALLKPPVVRVHATGRRLDRLMAATARFAWRRPAIILALLAAVVVVFGFTQGRLVFNTDPASYYPQGDPVLRDMAAIYGKAGGFEQIAVSFDAPEGASGYFLNAAALAEMEEVEARLLEIPDISYAVSLPDLLRQINLAATGRDELPENRAVVSMFARLLSAAASSSPGASLIGGLVNRDFTRLTISFRIYNSDTGHYMDEARFRALLADMRAVLAEHPTAAAPVIWGDLLRNLSFADSLRQSLLTSMAISVLLILALTVIVFRSPLYGLYSLVPLATGLLMNYVMMALTRIPLDMTTIMVSNIAIGVGVDSSIYMVIQFKRKMAETPLDPEAALTATLRIQGQPTLLASFSIVFGLIVFVAAAFRPVVYFGMLVLFTLLATTLGTLVTLPALLGIDARVRQAARHRGTQGPSPSA